MRFTGLTALAIALLAVSHPARAASANDKAAALCDKLAAGDDDKTNPRGIKGVATEDIDGKAALEPCAAAYAAFPKKPRYVFEYARALRATHDEAKAFSLMVAAAEAGHAVAMNHVGFYYQNSVGTAQDYAKAADWYQKAAQRGVSRAAYNLGLLYRDGNGVAVSGADAEKWLTLAGAAGRADAYADLGWMYETGEILPQSDAKAVHWYQLAAKGGGFQGMSNLGWMYDRGVGGLKQDHEHAFKLYLASANGGNADGMNNLAESYIMGEGVLPNLNKGLDWMYKAYDGGSPFAAYNLGRYSTDGTYIKRDPQKAAEYLIKALERNSTDARKMLIDQGGNKVPLDVIDALQDALIKRGGTFQKESVGFSADAVSYMKQIADKK